MSSTRVVYDFEEVYLYRMLKYMLKTKFRERGFLKGFNLKQLSFLLKQKHK